MVAETRKQVKQVNNKGPYIAQFHIHGMSRIGKFTDTKNRLIVT